MYTISFLPSSYSADPPFAIYDPRDRDLPVSDAWCTLTCNRPDLLQFTVPRQHRAYDAIAIRPGHIELRDDSELIFRGRIVSIQTDFNLSKSVEAEGILAVLNDSVIPPHVFPDDFLQDYEYQQAAASGNVVQYYLGWLLSQHNDQVASWQQLRRGRVTVSDVNNQIRRTATKPTRTMDIISSLIKSELGGYVCVRYGTGIDLATTYVDYLTELPDSGVEVRFGRNLLDMISTLDARTLYSAVYPVGAGGLTIASLPNGTVAPGITKYGSVVENDSLFGFLGSVARIITWRQCTSVADLLARAIVAAQTAGLTRTFSVSALDIFGGHLRARTMAQITSDPHGIAARYPITEIAINLLDPSQTTATFGQPQDSITDISLLGLPSSVEEA